MFCSPSEAMVSRSEVGLLGVGQELSLLEARRRSPSKLVPEGKAASCQLGPEGKAHSHGLSRA